MIDISGLPSFRCQIREDSTTLVWKGHSRSFECMVSFILWKENILTLKKIVQYGSWRHWVILIIGLTTWCLFLHYLYYFFIIVLCMIMIRRSGPNAPTNCNLLMSILSFVVSYIIINWQIIVYISIQSVHCT